MRALLNHQKAPLAWIVKTQHPFLALEMRLGKTLVAIRAAQKWGSKRPLVLAPLPVLEAWEEELDREGEADNWTLMNYERLLAMSKKLTGEELFTWQSQFDLVICDESTRLKNPKSSTSQLCCALFRDAEHRMCLSGLPAPEGPADYFQQFKFLHGKFMGFANFWGWRMKFFQPWGYSWEPTAAGRADIRAEVLRHTFFLTRKEAGVGAGKVYETRRVDPSPEQKRWSKEVKREFRFGQEETKFAIVVATWLSRIAGGSGPEWESVGDGKIRELHSLLCGDLRGQSVLVGFRFNHELERVRSFLRRNGFVVTVITGATPREERKARRKRFQAGEVQVLLVQQACARMGLDFSRASATIYYSNWWSLETRKQFEDRTTHPMKKEATLHIDLVTRDTPDEEVVQALKEKDAEAKGFRSRLAELIKAKYKLEDR